MDQYLTPWTRSFIQEREAHRRIGVSIGLVDICHGHHVTGMVLQAVLDNLTGARQAAGPRWQVIDDKVWVEATYQHWFQTYRIKERTVRRALDRLEAQKLLERQALRVGASDKRSALHIWLNEPQLQVCWEAVIKFGVLDPQEPET